MQIYVQARSEDFKRGGGEISNAVVFKFFLKKLPLSGAFSAHFLQKGGGEGPPPPPSDRL